MILSDEFLIEESGDISEPEQRRIRKPKQLMEILLLLLLLLLMMMKYLVCVNSRRFFKSSTLTFSFTA